MSAKKPGETFPRRQYYSMRAGKHPAKAGFDLDDFKRFFLHTFESLERDGIFQEWLGYDCVDAGFVPGRSGLDLDLFVFRRLRRQDLWPIHGNLDNYSEDDLFDMIEFLFDHASKGIDGTHHSFNDCGWHYRSFAQALGQDRFRTEINDILMDYKDGFELDASGEILTLGEDGLDALLTAKLPHMDPDNVESRVDAAKLKFRRRGSSGEDRRDAVRDLADVLEYLREPAKKVLGSKDELNLFNLANNFDIRHHNKKQQIDYDRGIWLSWMFYYYLATIHACVRLIQKVGDKGEAG